MHAPAPPWLTPSDAAMVDRSLRVVGVVSAVEYFRGTLRLCDAGGGGDVITPLQALGRSRRVCDCSAVERDAVALLLAAVDRLDAAIDGVAVMLAHEEAER